MPTIHLIRHGEVFNPNHVVYADLPGFNLSPAGVLEAHAAGRHLGDSALDAVVSSPLQRAVQTATAVARRHTLDVEIDVRLTESGQYPEWTGQRWDDIHRRFPDQIETYLRDATQLTDVVESVEQIAERAAAAALDRIQAGATAVGVVSHQDPIHAAALYLTGTSLSQLRVDPPPHCAVITLEGDGSSWSERKRWHPG